MPATGDLLELTFPTPQGPVGSLAEIVVDGSTLLLRDVVVYGQSGVLLAGVAREVLQARTYLASEARAWGFATLRITGHRVESSSSGNPGRDVAIRINLER